MKSFLSRWSLVATAVCILTYTASPADLFVAPDGSDSNPGTQAKPFASVEAARDFVRSQKAAHGLPDGGFTIWMRGGVYERHRSFELTGADSGEPGKPITYAGWDKEVVRFIGGRFVSGFTAVTNSDILARLPEKARAHVLGADLSKLDISDLGQLRSRGFGRPIVPAHLELFFRGNPMTLARWPNEGAWEHIAGFPSSAAQGDDHGGQLGSLEGGFLYAGDRPNSWKDRTNVWVHGYWAWDWANSYERVAEWNLETRHIKTAAPYGLYGFRKGQRFYFLNVLEELDEPGEYYLDRSKGQLYFWPPGPTGSAEALISTLEGPLVSLKQASHIRFRNLAFEATRGNGFTIEGGDTVTLAGCKMKLIGNYGVSIDGGTHHQVLGCDIEDTGDGGVSASGGDRQTLSPGGHVIEDCHFQRQGRWSKCYVPAVLLSGVGNRVSHNLIHDHPHCAILFTGNNEVIEWNEIHHVAMETGDVGAIYTGRDWTFRGNIIRNNFIHEIGGVGMGSMGVYMDDCVSGTRIEGNVFYKVTRAAFLGGGRDHQVLNNIFVDCLPAVQVDGRGLDKSPVWHDMVYDYMKKQLGAVPAELYRQRYPAISTLDKYYASDKGIPPEGNVIDHNICVGGQWLEMGWNAKKEMVQLGTNYVGADPGFANRSKLDFRLPANDITRRVGFQPIAFEQIGLLTNRERR